ncbi:hypothetical protein GCM10025868_30540 [Angustibacter aerolatus]|uniref:SGNH hydrolase-type esterase domain-containing protein n=1 Tax=Angustibacter aerolatus TaxID=1162965 RepID=A0ABQ6JK94_9ACTN|nr:hypothetical protein GCM10025868_30540 [Angustibacter aerolatus]
MFLGAVEVLAPSRVLGTVVALGDSLTDGTGSTSGADARWPDRLADRLAARTGSTLAVVDAGLSGNALLAPRPSRPEQGAATAARFDRDVLGLSGARTVVLLIGTNDLGRGATAGHLAQAVRDLVTRSHAAGLRVVGATVPPLTGSPIGRRVLGGQQQADRQRRALNAWLLHRAPFDAVVDVDAVLRDPRDPARLRPEYDSGDHVHPSDAGYAAVADAVPLAALDPRLG